MPIKNERALAVAVLTDVLEDGAYANIALRKAFAEPEMQELEPRQRAFATDLVNETLRNLLRIDHTINSFAKTPVDKMKPFIRNLLRISVCQINHMEKIPSRAAVNEAVNLTKARGMTNLSGFVNGVLRTISRSEPESIASAALKYSYPAWLYDALTGWLGEPAALDFCENSHSPPPVIIRTNTIKTSPSHLMSLLEAEGVKCEPFDDTFLILRQTGDISKLSPFQEGLFFVMDPGAMQAVHALSPKPGQTILDICAAPGGKSFAAACLMENMGTIRAFDIHPHRIELVNQTRKRLGITSITPGIKDVLIHDPSLDESADAVLLDAPCSGFGTIRKHPEIKYTRQPEDIKILAEKQRQMLKIAANYVKPGGTLVYCTCTVATEENMDNIEDFLMHHKNYRLDNAQQILPSPTSDGFFVARLLRSL